MKRTNGKAVSVLVIAAVLALAAGCGKSATT